MESILFINANLHGHINPTLPLVKELVADGNRVDYFCAQQFQEKVMETGAEFLNYPASLDNTDFIEFYKMCIRAFEDSEYFVVMSIGKKCDKKQLERIPSNFYVDNFLPQLSVLKHTDVFITHSGFNSVSEALYYGVPLYALPIVNDQHMVAKRVKDMQLGIVGQFKEITPQMLKDGVEEILNNHHIKENCNKFSQLFREAKHLSSVAKKLEEIARG